MSPRAEPRPVTGCPRCTPRRGGVAGVVAAGALAVGLLLAAAPGALAAPPASVPATSTVPAETWAAELALDGGDDSGLVLSDGGVRLAPGATTRPAEGVLTLAPRRLAAPTTELAGALTADLPSGTGVDVQARGLDSRGVWGDWLGIRAGSPARFAAPTVDVQVRLLLHGGPDGTPTPVVREVWLTARSVPALRPTTPRPTTTRPTTTRPAPPSKPAAPKPMLPGPRPPGPPPKPPKPSMTATTKPTTTTTTAPRPVVALPPAVVPQIVPVAATVAPTTTTTPPPTPTTTTTPATTTTTTPPTRTSAKTPTPTTSSPAALWNGAIATTGLTGFKDTPYDITGRSSVRVVDGPPKAIRFTVPSGSLRAEIEPDVPGFSEGQTRYFRLTYVLPPSFPTDPQGFQLATQWKNDGTGSPPLELLVEKGRFVLGGGYGRPGGSRLFSTDIAPVVTGTPVEIVVGIRFSSDPDQGRVDVWLDGDRKITDFRPPGGTLYPGRSSYWKIGLYRDTANASTATVDLLAAAMGTSYDSVR
jgi:polysaccharide lyase-like protein